MINEQTDVQIARRDKETDWEEVRHAHTQKITHADVRRNIKSSIPGNTKAGASYIWLLIEN